jgi:hypothetical protein
MHAPRDASRTEVALIVDRHPPSVRIPARNDRGTVWTCARPDGTIAARTRQPSPP